ncbi:MAG: outer membrane lipoprotein-sorting protein [Gemmataceae bacterium]|nr:outer membrane lipoprotein-sorting protein [Gemmataceae bacterium]
MRKLVVMLGCVCWLGITLQSSAQQDESRALIEKGIKALGDEKKLAAIKAVQIKAKGKVNLMNMDIPVTFELSTQLPDKIKLAGDLEINNMNISVVQVYDGKKGWTSFLGKTAELDKKQLEEMKNNMHVEKVTGLLALRDKSYKLSPLGEGKVEGRDVVGIQVTKEGARDVNLWFDKQNHLILKAEYRALDGNTMQEVNQEKIYLEYKEFNGLKMPARIVVKNDGNHFATFEVTDVMFVDRFDDSVFAKP